MGFANQAGNETSVCRLKPYMTGVQASFHKRQLMYHVLWIIGETPALYGLWCTVQGYRRPWSQLREVK